MTMAFKYQVSLCLRPKDILLITLNHMDAMRKYVQSQTAVRQQVENVYRMLIEVRACHFYLNYSVYLGGGGIPMCTSPIAYQNHSVAVPWFNPNPWTGTQFARCTMGLGHNWPGTQWDWDTMGLVHNRTGTQWAWDTIGLVHYGRGAQWAWDTMGLGQWAWFTMGLGHNWPGTQWDWDTMGLGHN